MCIIKVVVHLMHQAQGGGKMTNTELLEKKIQECGKKKSYLAKKCGLSRAGFRNCMINKSEYKTSHIDILCEELNITSLREKDSIFFAKIGA